ncbi:MAG: hypothetical protein N2050_03990 [Flavobacteriales bacterium]|nr:hypothetical protein [Flavobacteriales bacterium]
MGCDGACDARVKIGNTPVAGCGSSGRCGTSTCNKLNTYDWFPAEIFEDRRKAFPWVEVRFKNTRKDFFLNTVGLRLRQGEVVCVEGAPGFDVGVVSLTGPLVRLQMNKLNLDPEKMVEARKILRPARQSDVDRWQNIIRQETEFLKKAREIASELALDIKVSDVEAQGDGTKVIVYFFSEERIDFREMVKKLAHSLKMRVEMRQIGARQEAGLMGGLGSCGRELCCATWLRDFRTVTTSAVRYQFLSINSQKLAGQCGKLKCCLNYELDMYLEAFQEMPSYKTALHFEQGKAVAVKVDIFKRQITYESLWQPGHFFTLDEALILSVMEANKRGEKPAAPDVSAPSVVQRTLQNMEDSLDFVLESPAELNAEHSQSNQNSKKHRHGKKPKRKSNPNE